MGQKRYIFWVKTTYHWITCLYNTLCIMTGYKEVSLISKKGWNIHPYELPGVVEYYKAVGLILYWKLYGWSDITSCWSYPVLKALKQLQCCIFVFGVTISLAASLVMYAFRDTVSVRFVVVFWNKKKNDIWVDCKGMMQSVLSIMHDRNIGLCFK